MSRGNFHLEDINLFQKNMDFQFMNPAENPIHLYAIDTVLNKPSNKIIKNWLSLEEQQRAQNFRLKKDSCTYILCHATLNYLLSQYTEVPFNQFVITSTEYGKPTLSNHSIHYNLSHTNGMGVLAFSPNHALGVDIEKIVADFDVFKIAQRFFATKEIQNLQATVKNKLTEAFFKCWTRKEAFIKAVGHGLSYPLDQFTVSIKDDEEVTIIEIGSDRNISDWYLSSFAIKNQYIGAVAMNSPFAHTEFRNFELQNLES